MIAIVVLLSLVAPVDGTGAYCSAWHVDLADAPDVYDGRVFLQKHVETYGVNRYVAFGQAALCLHRVRVHGLVDAHAAASLRELWLALA